MITLDALLICAIAVGLFIFEHYYERNQKPKDAGGEDVKPPEYIDEWLKLKGFTNIGAYNYRQLGKSKPLTEWVYTSSNGYILVEMGAYEQRNIVGMFTLFRDNSCVETIFPDGRDIERPKYSSRIVSTGLEDAYKIHLQRVLDWEQMIVPLYTLDDHKRFEELHKKLRQSNGGDRDFILLVGGMAFLLASGVMFYFGEGGEPFLIVAIAALLIGLGMISRVSHNGDLWQQVAVLLSGKQKNSSG